MYGGAVCRESADWEEYDVEDGGRLYEWEDAAKNKSKTWQSCLPGAT